MPTDKSPSTNRLADSIRELLGSTQAQTEAGGESVVEPSRGGSWNKVVPGFVEEPYRGSLPNYLFRFRGLTEENWQQRLDSEIGNTEIFLSELGNQNDPEERAFDLRFFGSQSEIEDFWRGKGLGIDSEVEAPEVRAAAIAANGGVVPDSVLHRMLYAFGQCGRIACFTEDPYNPLMWALYATWMAGGRLIPHGGICLQYRIDESHRNAGLGPVTYQDHRPVVDIMKMYQAGGSGFRDLFFRKSSAWRHEKEWRIFLSQDASAIDHPRRHENAGLRFDEHALVGIIVGFNTPKEVRARIMSLVDRRKFKPQVSEIVRDRLTYRLQMGEPSW